MAICTTSWGSAKRISARSGIGLTATIGALRFRASTKLDIIRGELVPVFWPMTKMASACSKSSSTIVPLPTPIAGGNPGWSARGTCSSSPGSCWFRTRARRSSTGTRLRSASSRGVELSLMRAGQGLQVSPDQREGLIPATRNVMVGYRVISHRLGQSTLHLQPIVGLRHQLWTVCSAKNSRVARCLVASHAKAFAPFSQNSSFLV